MGRKLTKNISSKELVPLTPRSSKMASAESYLPLLRMSIALQQEPRGEPVTEMDPERRQWLKEAMSNLLKNPVDDMKEALKKLKETEVEDDKAAILDSLTGYVENIDLARDLHKIGGLIEVIKLLDSSSAQVRASAANIIGISVHNNPEPQQWALELGALEGLTRILSRPDATSLELTKATFGVSSLIRQNDMATVKFIKDLKGIALLLDVLRRELDDGPEEMLPARRKAVFLLFYLLTRAPAIVPTTAQFTVPVVAKALSIHKHDPDFRDNAVQVLRIYQTDKRVELSREVKVSVKESTLAALTLAKADEHDTVVEMCEEVLAAIRV